MSVVNIKVNGRDYQVACDDGQEEHLRLLADEIDDRVRSLVFGMGSNPGEPLAFLLTALTLVDELFESKEEIRKFSTELRRVRALIDEDKRMAQENRLAEMESAMATTLEEIAVRIEKIAEQIEIR
jgi:cell division protein ZapA